MPTPSRFRAALAAFLLCFAMFAPSTPAQTPEDQELLIKMQARSREIQVEILNEEDPARVLELQKQLVANLEDTADKLSPPMRVMLLLGMKVGQPLMEKSQAYMQAAADVMESPEIDLTQMTTQEKITTARKRIADLRRMNDEMLEAINELPAAAERILDESDDIPEDDKAEFLEGFLTPINRQIGPMRAMRNLDSRIYVEFDKMFELMADNWGKWSINSEEEFVEWEDEELEEAFIAASEQIDVLYQRQVNAASVMEDRM
jgi:hypothetical protein